MTRNRDNLDDFKKDQSTNNNLFEQKAEEVQSRSGDDSSIPSNENKELESSSSNQTDMDFSEAEDISEKKEVYKSKRTIIADFISNHLAKIIFIFVGIVISVLGYLFMTSSSQGEEISALNAKAELFNQQINRLQQKYDSLKVDTAESRILLEDIQNDLNRLENNI